MGTTSTSTAATSALPQSSALYTSAINKITNAGNQPFQPYQTAGYNNTGGGEFVAPVNAQQMAGIGGLNYYANAAQPYLGAAANWTANAGAPLTAAGIQRYYSPYMQNVAQSTEALLNQQNQQAMAGQLGNAINSGAFGGDRAGIAAANLNQQNLLAGANIYSGLENTGYNNALAAAQAQQQLGLAGAGQLAGIGQNIQLAGLQGAQSQIAGGTLMQQTQQARDTALAAQYAQERSYPFQVAQQYLEASGMLGPLYGSTSSQTQPGALFSDARMKENLKKVGETFDRQPIYSYNYKGDNHTQIGLIAQDVEHHHPEAVGLAGGMKTVNYDKATAQAANRGHFYSGGLVASSMGGHVGPEHERQGYATSGSVTAAELAPYLSQLNWGDFIRAHAAGLAGNVGGGGGGGGILGAGPYGQPLRSSGMQSRPLVGAQFDRPMSLGQQLQSTSDALDSGEKLIKKGIAGADWVNDNLINPQPDVTTKAKDPTRQAGVAEAHGGLVGRPHHATQGRVSNGDPLDLSADQNLVANADYQSGNNIKWTIPNSPDKSAGLQYATFPKTDSVASSLGSLLGGGSALLNTLGLGKGQGYATKGLNQDVLNQIDQTASNGIPLPNQPYVDPTTPQDYNTASQSASDYYGQPGWMDSPSNNPSSDTSSSTDTSNNPSSDTSSSTDTSSNSSTSFAMGGAAVLRHHKSNQANPSSKPHIAMPTFSNAGLGGGRSESERGKPHKAAGGAMVARHGYAVDGAVPNDDQSAPVQGATGQSFIEKALGKVKDFASDSNDWVPIVKGIAGAMMAPTAHRGAALAYGASTAADSYMNTLSKNAQLRQAGLLSDRQAIQNANAALGLELYKQGAQDYLHPNDLNPKIDGTNQSTSSIFNVLSAPEMVAAAGNQFYVNQARTPEEQTKLGKATALAGFNSQLSGLQEATRSSIDNRINADKVLKPQIAREIHDKYYNVATAPLSGGSAYAKLKQLSPEQAHALAVSVGVDPENEGNWNPETRSNIDKAAAQLATNAVDAIHPYTGDTYEVKDGVYRNGRTGAMPTGYAAQVLSPDKIAALIEKGNELQDIKNPDGSTSQIKTYKINGYSNASEYATAIANSAASKFDGSVPHDATGNPATDAVTNASRGSAAATPQKATSPTPSNQGAPAPAPTSPSATNSGTARAPMLTPQQVSAVYQRNALSAAKDPEFQTPAVPEGSFRSQSTEQQVTQEAIPKLKMEAKANSQDDIREGNQALISLEKALDIIKNKGIPPTATPGEFMNLVSGWTGGRVDNSNYQIFAKQLAQSAIGRARQNFGSRFTQSEVGLQLNNLNASLDQNPAAISSLLNQAAKNTHYLVDKASRVSPYIDAGGHPLTFENWNSTYYPQIDAVNRENNSIVTVRSEKQYNALPVNAPYYDESGQLRHKLAR